MAEPHLHLSLVAVNPAVQRAAFGTLWPVWVQAYLLQAEAYIQTKANIAGEVTGLPWVFSDINDVRFWSDALRNHLPEDLTAVFAEIDKPNSVCLLTCINTPPEEYELIFKSYIIQAATQFRPTRGYLSDMLRLNKSSLYEHGKPSMPRACFRIAIISEVISLPHYEHHLQQSYLEWYANPQHLNSAKTWEYCDATAKIEFRNGPIQLNNNQQFGLVLYAKMEPVTFPQ